MTYYYIHLLNKNNWNLIYIFSCTIHITVCHLHIFGTLVEHSLLWLSDLLLSATRPDENIDINKIAV